MVEKQSTEVLVVGAGPVGLTAALSLARRGVRTRIIDEQWRTAQHSYAAALHPSTLGVLERLGVLPELLANGARVRTIALYAGGERRAEVQLADEKAEFPFVLVVRQSVLESVLEKALRSCGVAVDWNHRLVRLQTERGHVVAGIEVLDKVASGYSVSVSEWVVQRTLEDEATFAIGADGHRSTVRQALGIECVPRAEPCSFAVFEFRSDYAQRDEVRIVLDEKTTSVLWPLPDHFVRWSFQLLDATVGSESRDKSRLAVQVGEQYYAPLTRELLGELLKGRAPWFRAVAEELNWAMAVRFDYCLAARFGRDRCWLAGDAGHTTGPVGAQSMNVGIREGLELARRMAELLPQGGPLDEFAAYDRERSAEWQSLLGMSAGLTAGPGTPDWVRQNLMRILPCLPAAGEDLAQLAPQLGCTYRVPGATVA